MISSIFSRSVTPSCGTSNAQQFGILQKQTLVVPYNVPRGNCCTYFPETNVLVPMDSLADKSRTQ